ncbi:hypothetical protein [uncultured Imperialibacter sp.]|uniref:hypothetical protein n=1 Tax=uncultured Imperialibacter sp. TaxID=1672639 RepID=UPI0030D9374C|tara:strand:+ start:27308 stop:27877 length:570 start_codon:yes stop_codon:yes gene_type:complete
MNSTKLVFGLIIILFAGCKSNSYYGAITYNEDKFTGTKEEMANYLVEVQNKTQFIKNASVFAGKDSKLRTTYLVANDVASLMGDVLFDLSIVPTKSGMKLPRALDSDADRDYQFIEKQAGTDKFDLYYINESLRYLTDLEKMMKAYASDGKEEQGRSFSSKHLTEVNTSITKLEKARDEVNANAPATSK